MKRTAILLLALGAVLALSATPATAKPYHDELTVGTARIDGPGLGGPITLRWRGQCGVLYPCSELSDYDDTFVQLAMYTGLSGSVPSYALSYYQPPARAGLGPAYRLTYEISLGDRTETVVQHLYPYARGRAWVFTPSGQRVFDRPIDAGWLPAPVSLRGTLLGLGLPAEAPAVAGAPAARTSEADPSNAGPWIALTAALLLALLVAAAIAGRGRRPALSSP